MIFYLLVLSFRNTLALSRSIPLGVPFQVVGLLSMCQNSTNVSKFNIDARLYDATMRNMFNEFVGLDVHVSSMEEYEPYKFHYTSFDACDHESLSESVVALLLDSQYNIEDNINGSDVLETGEDGITVKNWKYKSKSFGFTHTFMIIFSIHCML